jgi:hypothetical protein
MGNLEINRGLQPLSDALAQLCADCHRSHATLWRLASSKRSAIKALATIEYLAYYDVMVHGVPSDEMVYDFVIHLDTLWAIDLQCAGTLQKSNRGWCSYVLLFFPSSTEPVHRRA